MRYLVLFLLLSLTSKAQVVSYVKYKHEADYIVYKVDYKWQADLTYVETMNRYEAKQGVWYVSDRKEGVKLYRAKYKHEADLLIFRVGYRHDIKGEVIVIDK